MDRKAEMNAGGYFELVNWTKAQPTIPEKDAPWVKLYTSLLDNDAFGALDDSARVLIVALWLYAGRSGRHVFPVDPKWLRKKIPMLNQDPDLGPLLDATDAYGNPTPFVRIVDKTGIYNVHNSTEREKRERRQEKEKKTKPSRASEQKERKKKNRTFDPVARQGTESKSQSQSHDQTKNQEQSQDQKKTDVQTSTRDAVADKTGPQKPENPKESEGGGAARAPSRKPPHFDAIGKIPIWWSDPACREFSYRVFEALGLRCDPESQEGKSQRGTFASWLFAARARVPSVDWAWLYDKALAKAREIARYGKAARKPGAVWLTIMAKEIQARAGPSSRMG